MSLNTVPTQRFAAPDLPYLPRDPQNYSPAIGLIGCGGITIDHLRAYRSAGYRVTALCDLQREAAEKRRAEFYPQARVFTDHRDLLAIDSIEVVDVATHPDVRPQIVVDALQAGKHVLSQKPFVLDLDEGDRLVRLAEQSQRLLAVNQNGRWAPHFSYLREAVQAGLIGDVSSVHCGVHWDHGWVEGTQFEKVTHLILYDFAIHWFDFLATIAGNQRATRVFASTVKSPSQTIAPALLGQASVEFPCMQATLVFDGHTPHGPLNHVYLAGSLGSLRSFGVNINQQTVELSTAAGTLRPRLVGSWFPDGFHGAMGELLCAIEENREPQHSARRNLDSLELCFAAVASSLRHEATVPGSVRQLAEFACP